MSGGYAKLSVPRPVFEQAKRVAEKRGFRSTSEALLYYARQGLDRAEQDIQEVEA